MSKYMLAATPSTENLDAEGDLVELEFTPMTPEDTLTIGDRDYLFGTHIDSAVRPG